MWWWHSYRHVYRIANCIQIRQVMARRENATSTQAMYQEMYMYDDCHFHAMCSEWCKCVHWVTNIQTVATLALYSGLPQFSMFHTNVEKRGKAFTCVRLSTHLTRHKHQSSINIMGMPLYLGPSFALITNVYSCQHASTCTCTLYMLRLRTYHHCWFVLPLPAHQRSHPLSPLAPLCVLPYCSHPAPWPLYQLPQSSQESHRMLAAALVPLFLGGASWRWKENCSRIYTYMCVFNVFNWEKWLYNSHPLILHVVMSTPSQYRNVTLFSREKFTWTLFMHFNASCIAM